MTEKRKKLRARSVAAGCGALLAAVVAVAAGGTAHAAAGGDHLDRGDALYEGQSITSGTVAGDVTLIMQTDGNLVLYSPTGRACWASNTQWNGTYAIYQNDGNFVVYDSGNHALWASNTVDDGGTTVNINPWGQLWAGRSAISGYCQN